MEFDPASSKTEGYHLFLEPQGNLAEELQRIIAQLAAEYGGPVFAPHVTLLARISAEDESILREKAAALAASTAPFTLTLDALGMQEAYFRALYIQFAEQDAVRAFHARANTAFGMSDGAAYLPHLSLLYGNYPETQKAMTAETLDYPHNRSFLIDRVALYKTEGEAENWIKIAEFKLQGAE